jgi:hypothetical protein
MTTEDLVERLDGLDHNERIQTLIAHARGLEPDRLKALLNDLSQGDTHRRWLRIQAAGHSGDIDSIWQGLKDPSVMVRSSSAAFIGRFAHEIPASVLDDADSATLQVLFFRLMRRQNAQISEPLVQALIGHDRLAEATSLLCSCSAEFILARLKSVAWPEHAWTKIAKNRSDLFVQKLEDEFSASDRAEVVWQRYSSDVWSLLCENQPAIVCGWVERFSDSDRLPTSMVGGLPALLRYDESAVVKWLAQRAPWFSKQRFPGGLSRVARSVDVRDLCALGDGLLDHNADHFAKLISRLPFHLRADLFESATRGLTTDHVEWTVGLLMALPRYIREREALRMLGLPRAKTDGMWRRTLLGMRDIDLVREVLKVEASSAQAEERGSAHAALVRATFGSGKGVEETLTWLARTRNEQDPVRGAFLAALAEVPVHYFQDPEVLDAVISPSFEARDISYMTRASILRIARRVMTSQATDPKGSMFLFAISLLERLAGAQGTPDFPALYPNLPKGAENAIFLALKPWIQAAQSRQQAQHVFALWRALGKRAWKIEEFGKLIGDSIWSGNKNHAGTAASYWLEDPSTRDQRVVDLVHRDASALYLRQVLEHCHIRRQTLLEKRFGGRPPKGRFHDGKVTFIHRFSSGFWRWPTTLQRLYVDQIRLAEVDGKQYSATRASLIQMRARVPISIVSDFSKELASSDVVIQEAALGAIVWTDCPAGALPILVQNLDSDRARVAIYALPRLARLTLRTDFVNALAALLEADHLKVTVHKEVLRLLGQVGSAEAVVLLEREWRKALHRDVRIAALHAARSLLAQPISWEILRDGAQSESASVAKAVVQVPVCTVASRYRRRYLELMMASADHQDPEVRKAFFGALRAGWGLVDLPMSVDVAGRVIARLDELDPWRSALGMLSTAGRSRAEHAQVLALIEELLLMAQDATPAGVRDQMAHQRLVAVLSTLEQGRHPNQLTLMKEVAACLRADRDWWGQGAAMAVSGTENSALADVLIELVIAIPTALSLVHLVEAGRRAADLSSRAWTADEAQAAIVELCFHSSAGRLLAVAMLAVFAGKFGWGDFWIQRIAALRNDDDVDVRTAARSVWMTQA